jgi:hypothetical protein
MRPHAAGEIQGEQGTGVKTPALSPVMEGVPPAFFVRPRQACPAIPPWFPAFGRAPGNPGFALLSIRNHKGDKVLISI